MMKKIGIIRRKIALLLIVALSINSFGAVVSDNDGSAFITKAEFDSLKNNFQSQIDTYNQSIDSKIDGAIASYLSGISVAKTSTHRSIFDAMGVTNNGYKAFAVIGKNNVKWFYETFATGNPFGDFNNEPRVYNTFSWLCSVGPQYYDTTEVPNAAQKTGLWGFDIVFKRPGGTNANVTAEGSGNDVTSIRYGQRCFMDGHVSQRYYTTATSWLGMYPTWIDPAKSYYASPSVTFNFNKPSYQVWQTSGAGGFTTNFLGPRSFLILRDLGQTPTTPEYIPSRPLMHRSGVWDTNTWSVIDPAVSPASSGYFAGGASSWYGYVLNSAPSDKWGDNFLYFWPGGGDNKLFMMDQTNVVLNFKGYDLVPAKWGKWSDMGISADLSSFKFSFDTDLKMLAESRGYHTLPSADNLPSVADINLWFKGTIYDYDCENRRMKLSTLRYAQQTSQLGKDVTLGETPLIIHNVEKKGKMTIEGGGIALRNQTPTYDYKNVNNVYIAFTHEGAVNEVDTGTTAAPNWIVNNTIPFEYKPATGGSWTAATGNKLYMKPSTATGLVNFRFDVEKGDDIYMHVVCSDFRDNQNVLVQIQPDTVCMLEAED